MSFILSVAGCDSPAASREPHVLVDPEALKAIACLVLSEFFLSRPVELFWVLAQSQAAAAREMKLLNKTKIITNLSVPLVVRFK